VEFVVHLDAVFIVAIMWLGFLAFSNCNRVFIWWQFRLSIENDAKL